MKKTGYVLALMLLVAACHNTTQTTSGAEYLKKHDATAEAPKGSFDEALRKAADVEPTLTFPARIGIARIDHGQLSAVPGVEMEAWQKTAQNLGKEFGEFVPLSPMVAQLVASSVTENDKDARVNTTNTIRLGAARQHVDVVLVYETYSRTDTKSNLLSIADLTIIGGFILPSKTQEVQGYGSALLMDVMQAYPYGTATVTLDKEEELSSTWGWGSDRKKEISDEARTKTALKLAQETEAMFRKLRTDLEAKHKKTEGNV